MKTPEQWRRELPLFENLKWTPETIRNSISHIQLDAQISELESCIGLDDGDGAMAKRLRERIYSLRTSQQKKGERG